MDKYDLVNQFIRDFKSTSYCCHQIIQINMELEEVDNLLRGLPSKHGIELTPSQMKSNKPMPVYQSDPYSNRLLEIMNVEEKLLQKRNYYVERINECKVIELMSLTDQNILFDLYLWNIKVCDVAEKYGYSRIGLWKHIRYEISKLV